MGCLKDLKTLKKQILFTREKMNEIWDRKGCTDEEVLEISSTLDQLLNEYHQITYPKFYRKFNAVCWKQPLAR